MHIVTRAMMAPPPPVRRKAVALPAFVLIVTVRSIALRLVTLLNRLALRLAAAGDERRQPVDLALLAVLLCAGIELIGPLPVRLLLLLAR